MNIDLSPIESINVNPRSDALSAWIMYDLVQTLSEELRNFTSIAAKYTAKSPIVWQYFLCSAQQSIFAMCAWICEDDISEVQGNHNSM